MWSYSRQTWNVETVIDPGYTNNEGFILYSWNSTWKIGRHLADKPYVEVTMCLGPMSPDASDFPSGIPAYDLLQFRVTDWNW